ncbi:MAG: kelch repeat-containing protein [Kofleriaceae bacterium]
MLRGLAILCVVTACEDSPAFCDAPEVGPAWRDGPTLPGRRLEPGVAAFGTRLILAGGISTSAQEGLAITPEVLQLDTLTGAWSQLPDAPVAWTHSAIAGIGTTLYLLGGLEGPSFLPRGDVYALDLNAEQWRPLAPMPPGSSAVPPGWWSRRRHLPARRCVGDRRGRDLPRIRSPGRIPGRSFPICRHRPHIPPRCATVTAR